MRIGDAEASHTGGRTTRSSRGEGNFGQDREQGDEERTGEYLHEIAHRQSVDDEAPKPSPSDERTERSGRDDLYGRHARRGEDQRSRER